MASADDIPSDTQCCEAFQKCVEMEQAAKTLSLTEKKQGRSTAVRKAVKDGLKEPALVNICDATIMPKYQDKKTKKVTDVDFVKKMLPDLACESLKAKHKGKKPTAEEIKTEDGRLRKKLCENMSDSKQSGPKAGAKADSVTNRLTDTTKYTGAHKERFDKSGKGKGLDGREDKADTSGYVGNYKGAGTFDEAK